MSDEPSIPAENSIRCKKDGGFIQHVPAEFFRFSCNPHALPVSQQDPFILLFLLFAKGTYLLFEIVNGLVELFVNAIYKICN